MEITLVGFSGYGDSGEGGASLGRVFVMASLRFGHQKNASQLMAPVLSSETVAADGTRALTGGTCNNLSALVP